VGEESTQLNPTDPIYEMCTFRIPNNEKDPKIHLIISVINHCWNPLELGYKHGSVKHREIIIIPFPLSTSFILKHSKGTKKLLRKNMYTNDIK
jgi:hypothetical protein